MLLINSHPTDVTPFIASSREINPPLSDHKIATVEKFYTAKSRGDPGQHGRESFILFPRNDQAFLPSCTCKVKLV